MALGEKSIETRSWWTSYRGPLAIHAGAGLGPGGARAYRSLLALDPFYEIVGQPWARAELAIPRGAIVATCLLVDVRRINEPVGPEFRKTNEFAFGDYRVGRYGWLLDCVAPVDPPIATKGSQRLWKPEWHSVLEEAEIRLLEVQETHDLRCGVCGCTDGLACGDGCSWISADPALCSACVKEQAA